MTRRLLATLFVVALGFALVARADDPAKAKADPKKPAAEDKTKVDEKTVKDEAAIKQEQLSRQFKEFEAALLRLAQRMEGSTRIEDREKAVMLKKAIELASTGGPGGTGGTDTKFDRLVKLLKDSPTLNVDQIKLAGDINADLANDLRLIIEALTKDTRDEDIRAKIKELQEMLKKLNQVIRDQQTVRAWTDRKAMDPERLDREQRQVRNSAEDLIGKGQPKPGETKEAKGDAKGQGKQGDSKEGGKPGEARNDTKEAKGDERGQEGKPGENKEAKPGEAKEAGKPGDNKENKPGDARGQQGDPKENKPGDSKNAGQQGGDPKEAKPGDAKSGGQQGGEPKEAKPGDAKSGGQQGNQNKEAKPGEAKEGGKPEMAKENKPAEAKEAGKQDGAKENKPAEAKDAGKQGDQSSQQQANKGQQQDSKGKQDNKADSKGQQAQSGQPQQGQAKSQGQPQQGQPQQGAKGDPQQQQPQNNQNQQNQQQQANNDNGAKKKIQDGIEDQKKAEGDLKKPDLPQAAENQADAIQKFQDAAKKLEELLKQLRQEEIERILAALQARCERMLAMQIEVRDGTVGVYKNIADLKPGEEIPRPESQKSNGLSDREEEIVQLANKAIEVLKSEGTAVAFPETFIQIRDDMVIVANRLRKTDVGLVTQAIENDIIETLKDMIEALKKARQDNQQQKPQPPQQGQPQQGQPQDQKLIELLHELKMIRSLQVRVNDRTKLYGKEYSGEQAPAASQAETPQAREKAEMIDKELQNLAEREKKIFEVTNNIFRGKNK